MPNKNYKIKICTIGYVIVLFLLSASITPSQAYIDAGTGSLLLQLILGGVTGGLVFFKIFFKKIKFFFRKDKIQ